MRLVIGGGGTAGHVYPGLALLEQWPGPPPDVWWFGRSGGMEESLVTGAGVEFFGLRAGPLRGKSPVQVVVNAARLAGGAWQAWRRLRLVRPDVVLTTGGFVSVPVAIGSKLAGVPLVVFLPDVKPGLAVRAQRRMASRLAYAFGPLDPGAPGVVTGYPVRERFRNTDPRTARTRLGLDPDLPVVLIYGGSQGARPINSAVLADLSGLLGLAQLIHVCGELDYDRIAKVRSGLGAPDQDRYQLHAFLGDSLADAMGAADLCVARAGASTLAELPALGLPAILVPGSFSDQAANAEYLAGQGAALCLGQDQLSPGRLESVVSDLLNDVDRLAAMSRASRALARPDAAAALVGELGLAVEASRQ